MDWNSRLAVSYTDEDGNTVSVKPIDSLSTTFSLNAEPLHSIEATHIGVVYSPQSISFSLTVKAIGDVAARLTALALQGKRFDIVLQEGEGTSFSYETVVMKECIITSAAPASATIAGAPTATFSGFSLAASATPKGGAAIEIP